MMSYIWTGMILVSILFSILGGTSASMAAAAMEGASAGITLAISIAGALLLWSGLAMVMERSGVSDSMAKAMRPILKRLFPSASADGKALRFISANVSANLLGLGNAATPLGIEATKRMQQLSPGNVASDEMCLLIVMNTASIQLIPATVAAVRASLGATSPFDILPAVWVTSLCSVTAGILAAKLLRRFFPHG